MTPPQSIISKRYVSVDEACEALDEDLEVQ